MFLLGLTNTTLLSGDMEGLESGLPTAQSVHSHQGSDSSAITASITGGNGGGGEMQGSNTGPGSWGAVRKACHIMRSLNQGCSGDPLRLHTGTLSELTPPQPAEISAWQGWVELGWVPAHMSL